MFDFIRDLLRTAGFIVLFVVLGFFALIFYIFDVVQEIVACIFQPIPIGPFIIIVLMAIAIALPLVYIRNKIALYYFKKHPEVKRPAWVVKKIGPSDSND